MSWTLSTAVGLRRPPSTGHTGRTGLLRTAKFQHSQLMVARRSKQ
jgi:hypothetical protein